MFGLNTCPIASIVSMPQLVKKSWSCLETIDIPSPPLTGHRKPWQLAAPVQNCRVSESGAPKNWRLQTGSHRLFREPYVCDSCRDRRQNAEQCPYTYHVRPLVAAFDPGCCLLVKTPNRQPPLWRDPFLLESPGSSYRMNSLVLKPILAPTHWYSNRFQPFPIQIFLVRLPHS